jgi:CubicO group peptidase (beta-lactamase class C family)
MLAHTPGRGPACASLIFTLGLLGVSGCATSAVDPALAAPEPSASSAPLQTTPPEQPLFEGGDVLLRRHIASTQLGHPADDDLTPALAKTLRDDGARRALVERLGIVRSLTFRGDDGDPPADVYDVESDGGLSEWRLRLDREGAIALLELRVLEQREAANPYAGDLASALQTRVEQATIAGDFSGAVLVAKDGVPIFQGAYGLADRERGIPNQLDTRFRIASLSKMFTAVATLQLVQAGKLRLDDPLSAYLPDYPNQELAATVNAHQLLTHTAGIRDAFEPGYRERLGELRTLTDYVARYGQRPTQFTPGSRFQYSNYGFIVLGELIERASGEDYYEYVDDHVYAPAGMRSSGSLPEDALVSERAVGYVRFRPAGAAHKTPAQGARWSNAGTLPYRGTSAGGSYSTVGDLLAFASALGEHRLLDRDHTELLTLGKVDAMRFRYAYGFEDHELGALHCIGHTGGAPGMSAALRICKPVGGGSTYVIAVLANMGPPTADRIVQFSLEHIDPREGKP